MEKYINGYLNHSWTILYISTAPLDTVASFVSWLVSLNFFLVCFPSIDAYSAGSREVQGHSCFALVYLSLIPPSCLLLWSILALWSSFDSWYLQIFAQLSHCFLFYHLAWTLFDFPHLSPSRLVIPSLSGWLVVSWFAFELKRKRKRTFYFGLSLLSNPVVVWLKVSRSKCRLCFWKFISLPKVYNSLFDSPGPPCL